MRKISNLLKNNHFIFVIYRFCFSAFFRFLGLFIKIDDNLILFNGLGFGYNDSPKVIFEKMLNSKSFDNYKFVWALANPKNVSIERSKIVKIDTLKYFLIALKSKYWISCMNIERGLLFKKKKTIYINTWHGIPLKAIGNNAKGRKDFNFSSVDYFCYSTEFDKKIFINAFGLTEKQFFNCGMARNDFLFENQNVDELKKELGLPLDKKIILYMPTFREEGVDESINRFDFNEVIQICKNEAIIITKSHHYCFNSIQTDDKIFDFSNIADPTYLYLIADLLITDYSSTIFDYCITEKPFILYAYDYDEFKKSRGFSFDISLIFKDSIVFDKSSLYKKIQFLFDKKNDKISKDIKNRYCYLRNDSAEKCLSLLKKENIKYGKR